MVILPIVYACSQHTKSKSVEESYFDWYVANYPFDTDFVSKKLVFY